MAKIQKIRAGGDERPRVASASCPAGPAVPAAVPSGLPGTVSANGPWWRPALTDALLADSRPSPELAPDWALFVEEAVTEAPERVAIGDREDMSGLRGFEHVVAPFTAHAARRLRDGLPRRLDRWADLDAVQADFERHLARRLARQAARTLVLEL
ncbi:hypothetical protein ACWC5G_27015, partial [Streptomyces sp. NPDC001274]